MTPVVSLHDELMRSGHECEPVAVIKRLGYVLAEGVARTPGWDAPAAPVVRVRPQEVAHGAFVGHFLQPVEGANVVERVDAGAEAAVQAKDLPVHQGGEGQVVEQVGEVLPHVCVAVFAQAFVVKPVDLGDLTRFMVAAKNRDSFPISHLEIHEFKGIFRGLELCNFVPLESPIRWRFRLNNNHDRRSRP